MFNYKELREKTLFGIFYTVSEETEFLRYPRRQRNFSEQGEKEKNFQCHERLLIIQLQVVIISCPDRRFKIINAAYIQG